MAAGIRFGPFVLDLAGGSLWRGGEVVPLRPKTWEVLRHLVEHAGDLVTKDALLGAVWPDVTVTEELPGISVREIRRALGDTSRTPRFIETVHGRGYRFRAAATSEASAAEGMPCAEPAAAASLVVGRDDELGRLASWLSGALEGRRRIVFVSGDAGIGKTTLVETFLTTRDVARVARVARGQCVQQHTTPEPFLPVLEALARLCRGPDGGRVTSQLRRWAPAWLVQLGGGVDRADCDALGRETAGITPERALRAVVEALEAMAAERPLVLVFEDLQWSDHSTLDFLSRLAQRDEPARLLVLATYRPVDVILREHPLRALVPQLAVHGRCHEVPLDLLGVDSVGSYLAARFPGAAVSRELTGWLHRRSDGNPLFMATIADALVSRGVATAHEDGWRIGAGFEAVEVPHGVRQFIAQQIERLDVEERRALEAASVAGTAFAASGVAAALGVDVEAVEAVCDPLAGRGQLLRRCGVSTWPDGTLSARYEFAHALHRESLYDGVAPARRIRLHRRLGERLETAYGAAASDVAEELATHFAQGGDGRRAAMHHERAATRALQRHAPREAAAHLRAAVTRWEAERADVERTAALTRLHLALAAVLVTLDGYTAPAVGDVYERLQRLLGADRATPQMLTTLCALSTYHRLRGDLARARAYGEQASDLATRLALPPRSLAAARNPLAAALLFAGSLDAAHALDGTMLALFAAGGAVPDGPVGILVPAEVTAIGNAALTAALLGFVDQARAQAREALERARAVAQPYTVAYALFADALLRALLRDAAAVHASIGEAAALVIEHGLGSWDAVALLYRGHALVEEGRGASALADMARGLEAARAAGARLGEPFHLAAIARAHLAAGCPDAALARAQEGVGRIATSGAHVFEAELHRVRGEVLLARAATASAPRRTRRGAATDPPDVREAEGAFDRACEVARGQGARLFELRAAVSRARLDERLGRVEAGRALLATVVRGFPEPADVCDVAEAKALLDRLAMRTASRPAPSTRR